MYLVKLCYGLSSDASFSAEMCLQAMRQLLLFYKIQWLTLLSLILATLNGGYVLGRLFSLVWEVRKRNEKGKCVFEIFGPG